jgi:thioredoxin
MNKTELFAQAGRHGRPVVVEFWAPWCAPCRAMAPALEQTAREFNNQVKLVRLNADEHPELLRELRVFSIPSMIAIADGAELFRRSGVQSAENLRGFFTAAQEKQSTPPGLAPTERLLRAGAGFALLAAAIFLPTARLLAIPAAVLLFSAVYDRCPIYHAVSTWVKEKL